MLSVMIAIGVMVGMLGATLVIMSLTLSDKILLWYCKKYIKVMRKLGEDLDEVDI